MLQVIGKVSATEKMPSTIDNFYFWTDKGQILSPFDIVKVEHVSSNSDKSITYGVIEEITHVTDAASHFTNFISSNFGDTADSIGQMNRLGMNYVKAKVVCNTDDIYSFFTIWYPHTPDNIISGFMKKIIQCNDRFRIFHNDRNNCHSCIH